MRRQPAFGFPPFAEATEALRALGHDVFSPAERDAALGFDPVGMTGHEDLSTVGFDLRDALASDLAWIARNTDALCVLPGWEHSTGARAEVALAAALDLSVGYLYDFHANSLIPAAALLHPVAHPSGETRVTSETGGQKGQKLAQVSRIPAQVLLEIAEHFGKGVVKYPPDESGLDNWRRGYAWSLSFDPAFRHLLAALSGEDIDPETGSKHVIAAAWHCITLADRMNHPEMARFDDRQDPRC